MAPISSEYEDNILAAIISIVACCTPEEAFIRLEKGVPVTDAYDVNISIRQNAKNMGASPTTVQKIKKNIHYRQASLF